MLECVICKAFYASRLRRTRVRIVSRLVSIAVSDLSTELSMATPSEVKAYVR